MGLRVSLSHDYNGPMRKSVLGVMIGWAISTGAFASGVNLKSYYKNLNYFNKSAREEQLIYEGKFKAFLKSIVKKEKSLITPEEAKSILYGTLFLTNINQGYRFGQISFEEMVRYERVNPVSKNAKEELIEREKLILDNLYLAKELFPQDYRIDSWIGTHELYQEELTTGTISNENFEKMFKLASENVFSYTAMAVIAAELTLSKEQNQKMLSLAQMVSDDKLPCVKNDKGRCFEKKLAPQTNEIGKLITGDIYLREASTHLEGKMDPEGKRINSGVSARVIYGLVKQKKVPNLKGLDWSNIYLKGRVKAVNNLLWHDKAVPAALTDSIEFRRAYSCYACHAQ